MVSGVPQGCQSCLANKHILLNGYRECLDGETAADPLDCRGYAICSDGFWKKKECAPGLLWNDQKHTCSAFSECNVFKEVECKHGQVPSSLNKFFALPHGLLLLDMKVNQSSG